MTVRRVNVGDFVDAGEADIQTGPFGTQLRASDYTSDGTPVINVRNIGYGTIRAEALEYLSDGTTDRLRSHVLAMNDIVFGRKGAVDRHLFVGRPEAGWIQGSDCIRLRFATNRVVPKFASYAFLTTAHQAWMLSQAGNKATMASLNHDIIKRIPVPLPDPTTQQRVVEILSPYDEITEINRRRIALLEDAARQLFLEWFVRLRFPGREHTRVVDGVPDGWRAATVGDFVAVGDVVLQTGPFGTQLKASDYTDDGTPVINVRNIGYGAIRPDKLEFVPDETLERLRVHVLRPADIVFGRKGAVDRHVLVDAYQDGWVQGSDCIRLRSLTPRLPTAYLSFQFREVAHRDWMMTQCSSKATMASLNQGVIERIPVLVPPRGLVEEFRSFTLDMLSQIGRLAQQSEKATKARDILLPRLMSGELAV